MCAGPTVQAWEARCIRELMDFAGARPDLLIIPDGPAEGTSGLRRIQRKRILHQAYWEVLRPRAFRAVHLADQLGDVPSIRCRVTTRGKFSQYFAGEDLRRIRDRELDFILRFAFGIVRGDILTAARYGVWSFHHDDELRYRGGPPCFWEIYRADPVTGAILQRLTNRLDGGIVLRRGYFRTALHSLRQNIDTVHFGAARWPALVCRDIRANLAAYIHDPPSRTTAPVFHAPDNGQMIRFAATVAGSAARRIGGAMARHEQWCLGVVDRPISAFLEPDGHPRIRWFRPPQNGRFVADPFGVVRDGSVQILYEDFRYRTAKGVIASVPADASALPPRPNVALALAVHASYPYLVVDRGDVYCIPETHEAREVALYRAIEFPSKWERVATLLEDVEALDTTVFRHDGRWWMTHTDQAEGKDLNLFVWHASDLRGPWIPHARNPVKTDVRSSRPAGTPFVHHGDLYRPAQDCSRTYGGAISMNRVEALSPTEFREEVVLTILPSPRGPCPDGLHTISAVGDLTLVDGKRNRFTPSAIPYVLRGEESGRSG